MNDIIFLLSEVQTFFVPVPNAKASLDVYCTSQHELTNMQDSSYQELAGFLDAVERHGTGVLSSIDGAQRQTASEEARLLKAALLRLRQ